MTQEQTLSRKRQRDQESVGKSQRKVAKTQKIEYKKGLWDKEEDEKLLELVKKQLCEIEKAPNQAKPKKLNWTLVSKGLKTRSCKQCRERWVNHLNPGVRKTKWTHVEDKLLLELAAQNPRKWALIARQMPGRTENMVKIRWNSLNKQLLNSKSQKKNNSKKTTQISKFYRKPRAEVNIDVHADHIPFIRTTFSEPHGSSHEHTDYEPFIEDYFFDDHILDTFLRENSSCKGVNERHSPLNNHYDHLVPINL